MTGRTKIKELARRLKNEYQREWRRRNPDKVKKSNQRHWERKALAKMTEAAGKENSPLRD